MISSNLTKLLKQLEIEDTGRYDEHFYVIEIEDSNAYAKMYTKLNKNATNTEYPNFGVNTAKSTIKITNYFETEVDNVSYQIFLIADFDNDKYYVKIGEK